MIERLRRRTFPSHILLHARPPTRRDASAHFHKSAFGESTVVRSDRTAGNEMITALHLRLYIRYVAMIDTFVPFTTVRVMK